MMDTKVTIITVCRNSASTIEDTILSVINQTYSNIEYIIIDGASTDGTQEIIRKYEDRIAYWISEPDKGIYDAMNKGLEHATGEWVNFMNAGDTFVDEMVVNDIFALHEYNADVRVIGGKTNVITNNGIEDLPPAIEDIRHQLPFCHQSSFTRLGRWDFDTNYRIAADYKVFYDIWDRFGEEAFVALDRTIANFDKRDSTTFQNLHRAKKEYLKIQSKHKDLRWWKEFIKYLLRIV